MASKEEEDRSSYQAIPESRKINRLLSPDSLDADIEPSSSESEEICGSGEEAPTNEHPFKELQDSSEKPAMSNKRRICLVGSLLLCVFTVFAFAFILPCHHKTCLKETKWPNWSKNFTGISPLVLRDFDTNDSSSKRLIVGFTHQGRGFHILNHTCPGCHGGVVAVNGGNGDQVWASGTFGQLKNVLCDLAVKNQEQSSCIALEGHDKILRIDTHDGYQHWITHRPGSIKAFRTIKDINEDGVDEVVVLHSSADSIIELCVMSGQTGRIIGACLPVFQRRTSPGLQHEGFLRVHHLSTSQVLVIGIKLSSQETGTLIAIRIDDLIPRLHNKTIKGLAWGDRLPDRDGFIQLYDTLVLTEPLFADLNHDGVMDIVICTLDAGLTIKAINGKDTSQLWSRKLTSTGIRRSVPSIVLLGDKTSDIAIMIHLSNQSTRIVVISGKNGLAQWMFTLKHPLSIPPVGVSHKSHIPRGLLLWLPQVKITQHLSKREVGVIKDFKTKRFGRRFRRDTLADQNNKGTPVRDLLNKLKRKRSHTNEETDAHFNKKSEEGDDYDIINDDDFVNSILQLQKDGTVQTNSYTRIGSRSDTTSKHYTDETTGDSKDYDDDNLRKTDGIDKKYFVANDKKKENNVNSYHHQDDDDEEHDYHDDDNRHKTHDGIDKKYFVADVDKQKENNVNLYHHQDDDDEDHDYHYGDDDYDDLTDVTTTAKVKDKNTELITNRKIDVNTDRHPIKERKAHDVTKFHSITERGVNVNSEQHRPITKRYDFIRKHLKSTHNIYSKRNSDDITEDQPITGRDIEITTEKQPITEKITSTLSDNRPATGHISDVTTDRVHDRERKAEVRSGNHITQGHTNFKFKHYPITEGEDDVMMSEHRPITEGAVDVMSGQHPITERQVPTDDLSELRDLLLNLEDRLKRETTREIQPTRTTTTHRTPPAPPTTQSKHTMSSTTQTISPEIQTTYPKEQSMSPKTQSAQHSKDDRSTTSESITKQTTTEEDKPLNCDLPVDQTNKAMSAVLVYRDAKNQLQLMEIAREKVIYIAPEDFVNKFGEQPPISYSCVPLVPMVTSSPMVTDIDGDRRPDLIYAINYITFNESTKTTKSHLMKLRKVDILDAIDDKKKGRVHTKLYKSEKKNYKRNENFDSPFLKWET